MKDFYLKKADINMPPMYQKIIEPPQMPQTVFKGDSFVTDLGCHYVGNFSLCMKPCDAYTDAPVKLSIRFCETAREIDDDFSQYKGNLCSSWLQEEIVYLHNPGKYTLPGRYAARYIKIQVVDAPVKIVLSDFCFTAVTSADENALTCIDTDDQLLKKIDEISATTLKNCMHRVFEDGPKRDRRLWIGDLRLEALTNYVTFNNTELVRRCIYLFAATHSEEKGMVAPHLYEYPDFVSSRGVLTDYALLYAATVCDYLEYTDDISTFAEVYPIVKKQILATRSLLSPEGILTAKKQPGRGTFIDWCPVLCKTTSLHGVYMYVLDMLIKAADRLGSHDKELYLQWYEEAKKAALKHLYDSDKKSFVNKYDNYQNSVHSAVWMVLGKAVEGKNAKTIIQNVLSDPSSIKPFTPYMHHYVVEAMIKTGMIQEAKDYIKSYWGAMAKEGADTFYEVFVPDDADFSPYGDRMINSMCHAWSCTPSYFVRKYFV